MEQLPIPKYIKLPVKVYKYNHNDKEDKQEMSVEKRVNPFFVTSYTPGIMITDGKEHPYTQVYIGSDSFTAHISVEKFEELIDDYIEELKQGEITGK